MKAGALYAQTQTVPTESRKVLERYIQGDGVIVGWGLCRDGELGTSNIYNVATPLMIGGHDKPIRMACCGLSSTWLGVRNFIMTMGSGMWGELAVGNPRFCPRVIANEMNMPISAGSIDIREYNNGALPGVYIDVDAGFAYFASLSMHGDLLMWGANNYAQCHADFQRNACCGYPQRRAVDKGRGLGVACANFATFVRTTENQVFGWGLMTLLGDEDDIRAELETRNLTPQEAPNTENRLVATEPVPIRFFDSKNINLIRAGPWHVAATTTRGDVYTWGLGNNGRLGHGDEADHLIPTLVKALSGQSVVEVACGSFHTVFVTADGVAYACGDNRGGQCGVLGEVVVLDPTPIPINGGRHVIHASCGRTHTVLLLNTGDVVAYGTGLGLGIGMGYGVRMVRCQPVMETYTSLWVTSGPAHNFALTIPKVTSMLVLGVPHRGVNAKVLATTLKEGILSCGVGAGFTVMVSRRGNMYSLGVGGWGQLGFEPSQLQKEMVTSTPEGVPVVMQATRVQYFSRTIITHVAAGFSFAMAITESDRVYAWGNNSYGQCALGVDPKKTQRVPVPREVTWLADKQIMQLACGSYFALAMSSSGEVFSWGTIECCGIGMKPSTDIVPANVIMNNVGKESSTVVLMPVKIPTLRNIIQIAAGGWHALALNAIGEIYAWGVGAGGRLGLRSETDMYVPTRIVSDAFFTRIGCGCYTSYGITEDAKLYVWGANDKNQLGVEGAVVSEPTHVLDNVRECSLGKYFTLALTYAHTFHMSGYMETESSSFTCSSFHDTDGLPDMIKPETLAKEHLSGLKIFGSLEHAIVLVERDAIPAEQISDVTKGLRNLPEEIVKNIMAMGV